MKIQKWRKGDQKGWPVLLSLGIGLLPGLSSCHRLGTLLEDPPRSPRQFCEQQPCLEWGDWVLTQPVSSFLVYMLALMSLGVGLSWIRSAEGQQARLWWGISLLLGGVGAVLAGTSFQALGFEIKCAGREYCQLTSWWELGYNACTVAGGGALLIAVAWSSLGTRWVRACMGLAIGVTGGYCLLLLTGALLPNRFLVSFELMLLVIGPVYLALVILHAWQAFGLGEALAYRYLGAWSLLLGAAGIQKLWEAMHWTEWFWEQGIWFSENDAFHLVMAIWLGYVYGVLRPRVEDR